MTDLIVPANGAGDAAPPRADLPPPNYAISEGGMAITMTIGANLAIQHVIPAPVMHEIMRKWREVQHAQASTAQLVADVMRSKR